MTDEHETPAPFDDTERATIRRLLLGADPVPAEVVAAAKSSLTWRTIDAELAALAYDSLLSDELVGTRGAGGPRAVSFEYGTTSIELEISSTGQASSLIGQIAPAAPIGLELQHASGGPVMELATDARGRFSVAEMRAGQVRFLLRFASGRGPAQLLTEWITI